MKDVSVLQQCFAAANVELEALELKEEFARRLGEHQRTIDILKVRHKACILDRHLPAGSLAQCQSTRVCVATQVDLVCAKRWQVRDSSSASARQLLCSLRRPHKRILFFASGCMMQPDVSRST